MLLYVFVMAFCLCVVFVYYRKLYLETRNNIINSGRINAMESAKQIDMHMSGSIDTIKIAGYTVDNMIREKRSEEEILDYLTEETNAVSDTMVTETTGLYGYINDKYLDGAGWDPGAGFNATERPWYIEAVAGDGELVVVDPYVDLDTGGVMITFARLLSDKKSVISAFLFLVL